MVPVTIFDIKRFAVHDGPGIRTTVFLKGCPMSCWWCHNPESRRIEPEEVIYKKMLGDKEVEQRKTYGITMSIQDVLEEILKDKLFFEESQGGVTFSGGEPFFQITALSELLKQCKRHGLHTTIDTCGYAKWSCFERVLAYTDLFLYDLKFIDNNTHQKFTSVGNKLILANLKNLLNRGANVTLRVPVIPGVNNSKEELERFHTFLLKEVRNDVDIHLLPYHNIANSKYRKLNVENRMNAFQDSRGLSIQDFKEELSSIGFHVKIGG